MRAKNAWFYCALTAALLLFVWVYPAAGALSDEAPQCRALLIACDQFVSAAETTPIGKNNLARMESILSQDMRGFRIHLQYGVVSSKESLAYSIEWAFRDAKAGDISLLYLCTHGRFDTGTNNPGGELLLSDGSLEGSVTPQELNAMLDEVAGTKVLLVDACNSGVLVGKGISPDVGSARVPRAFQSGDYKVLTSSGASEQSWYYNPTLEHAPPGSSYFTTALALGAGYLGRFPADTNRDGVITLAEMYAFLAVNQASSTVQMYPQNDEFPLLVYDRALQNGEARGELSGFEFHRTALDPARPEVSFSYTANVPTRVVYYITYLKDGQWNWKDSVGLPDVTEFDGDADPMGDVGPGRKQIKLDLSDVLPKGWTYAMIHVMTMGDREADRSPFIYASRVLSSVVEEGDPELSVKAPDVWDRSVRPEAEIFVAHAFALNLTVVVSDAEGAAVQKLCVGRMTRPQALSPDGSLFYWNGRDKDGEAVPPGTYIVSAQTRIGGQTYLSEQEIVVK